VAEWRILHQLLLRETDRRSLERLVYEAEAAIFDRCQRLAHTPGSNPELRELQSACDDLYTIKTRKLGWPDPLAGTGSPSPRP
jgi:hypothetical protein